MRSRLLKGLMVTTLVASLNGCGELPVVGDLGAGLSGLAAPVMGLLDPVIGQFFPKEPPPPPPPRPRRRRPAANRIAVTPGATGSAETAIVTQTPQAAYSAWSERNRRFDKLRTDGLMQLYNGQTAGAIQSFKAAQALRPEDSQLANLMALAQNPSTFRAPGSGGTGPAGAPPSLPQPGIPDLPQGASGALNQLLKGAQGAPGAQGDQPGGLF